MSGATSLPDPTGPTAPLVPGHSLTVDLLVIGCGPAGEKGAVQAAFYGKSVVVVERGPLGGACVHTGTLPSKGLRESSLALAGLRNLGLRGITCNLAQDVRVDELLAHKDAVAATETARIEANLARHNVQLLRGEARLVAQDCGEVTLQNGQVVTVHASVVLLATGTHPHRPADLPFASREVWCSDEVVQMDTIPASLLVYGAGVIGCEYASMFAALGVEVHLIEPRDRVLPFIDQEIAANLVEAMSQLGVRLHTNSKYHRCEVQEGQVRLHMSSGPALVAERLLFAAGRTGNVEGLGLQEVGVRVSSRGLIEVDKQYYTGVGRIYAVGDVIGFPALASTSMDQGRVAMCHAFGFSYKQSLASLLPYGIYTIPECSLVGATEQELEQQGRAFEVGRARYQDNARAQLMGNQQGLLKLLFCPDTRELLGVHVVGERASELVHIGMMVMQFGGKIDAFIDAVFNYPTLSELFKYAAYDGLGRLARRKAFEAAAVATASAT